MAIGKEDQFDFEAFSSMADADIDTSDIPTRRELLNPQIGKYSDIEFRGYDVRSIANWCLRSARNAGQIPTKLWLNKIVALIYEEALVVNRSLLTPAKMEAWEFGPVFREIYLQFPAGGEDLYFKRFNVRERRNEIAIDPFDPEDLQLFSKIWIEYGHLSGSALTTITHRPGTPWHRVWEQGGRVNPGMNIDIDVILGRDADRKDG